MKHFAKAVIQSFIQIVFLVIGSILFAFLIAEIIFRMFAGPLPPPPEPNRVLIHEASDNLNLLYKPSPNASNRAFGVLNQINSAGFRDRDYPIRKSENVKRMIFLGDSVVYGYGLESEETIPKQLEDYFFAHHQSVEVLNLGVSGYEAHQAVEFFKEVGLQFEPDVVVVGYTLNDSIYASMELDFFHDQVNHTVRVERPEFRKKLWGVLFRYSCLMRYLDQKFHLQRRYKKFRSYREQSIWHYLEDRNRGIQDSESSPYRLLAGEILRDAERLQTSPHVTKEMLGFVGIGNDDMYSSHWNVSKGAFLELRRLSGQHGFGIAVVIFPYMRELDRYALGSVHEFLRREFETMGFFVIDLLPFVQGIVKNGGPVISSEPIHFNAYGAKAVGEYLYQEMAGYVLEAAS